MTTKTAMLKMPKGVKKEAPAPKAKKEPAPLPEALQSVDKATEQYANDYGLLYAEMASVHAQIEAIKRAHMPALRSLVAQAKASKAALSDAIIGAKAEFDSPRTRHMHGFKVGMQKQKGSLVFADEDKSIELIQKHFPEQFDVLVATTLSIVKNAAGQLPAVDLKRIGGEITDPVDQVVISSQMGDVEKIVTALIADKAES